MFENYQFEDKIILYVCYYFKYVINIILILGLFLPHHLILWHSLLTFIILLIVHIYPKLFYKLINNIIKNYKDDNNVVIYDLNNFKLDIDTTYISLILLLSTIMNLYPNYSFNKMLIELNNKLNKLKDTQLKQSRNNYDINYKDEVVTLSIDNNKNKDINKEANKIIIDGTLKENSNDNKMNKMNINYKILEEKDMKDEVLKEEKNIMDENKVKDLMEGVNMFNKIV